MKGVTLESQSTLTKPPIYNSPLVEKLTSKRLKPSVESFTKNSSTMILKHQKIPSWLPKFAQPIRSEMLSHHP